MVHARERLHGVPPSTIMKDHVFSEKAPAPQDGSKPGADSSIDDKKAIRRLSGRDEPLIGRKGLRNELQCNGGDESPLLVSLRLVLCGVKAKEMHLFEPVPIREFCHLSTESRRHFDEELSVVPRSLELSAVPKVVSDALSQQPR